MSDTPKPEPMTAEEITQLRLTLAMMANQSSDALLRRLLATIAARDQRIEELERLIDEQGGKYEVELRRLRATIAKIWLSAKAHSALCEDFALGPSEPELAEAPPQGCDYRWLFSYFGSRTGYPGRCNAPATSGTRCAAHPEKREP